MFSTVISGGLCGMETYRVCVEVDISTGLPVFNMVGLLSGEVREAKERVLVALRNTGYDLPPRKITVNLAPADRRKEGNGYDLPIALGILESLGYFEKEALESVFVTGELGLNGEIKPVRGILPMVKKAEEEGMRECIVPKDNAKEGAVIPGICVRGAQTLAQVVAFLQKKEEAGLAREWVDVDALFQKERQEEKLDFSQVCGQEGARSGRDRCRRLSQSVADRSAGSREKHDRQEDSRNPAASYSERKHGGDFRIQCGRGIEGGRTPDRKKTLSESPPYGNADCIDWGQQDSQARRDLPGPQGRTVFG